MLERFYVTITSLQRKREVIVLLPDDYYQSSKHYPVLYINDGQNAFIDEEAFLKKSWGFREYSKEKQLDVIMVGIFCNFEGYKRIDEYGPWVVSQELSYFYTRKENFLLGGEGKMYIEWLIHECKGMIDTKYRTMKDDTAICGSSMGAVISAYASLTYPEVFSKCAALSTAYWLYMDEFKELIHNSDPSKMKWFYFDLGDNEGHGDKYKSTLYLESNNKIYHELKKCGFPVYYSIFKDAKHNEWEWAKRVPIFMELFYGGTMNV